MRHPDDYGYEMDRLNPRKVDAALEGRKTGDPSLDRTANLVADVRHVLLAPPGPEIQARHVTAMAAAARSADRGFRPVRPRRRPGRRGLRGLALAAALVLGAGIAGAVTLPEQGSDRADEALAGEHGRAGEQGLDQAGAPAEQSAHGQEVAELAQDESLEGCEKGQAVSDLASSNADGHRNDDPAKDDPCAKGEGETTGGGEETSARGQTTSEEAKAGDHGQPASPGSQSDQAPAAQGQDASGHGGAAPDQAGIPGS